MVSWSQPARALLISIPVLMLFLIVLTVVMVGIVVLAGFAGQGRYDSNPANTAFSNSAFVYAKVFGLIAFLRGCCKIKMARRNNARLILQQPLIIILPSNSYLTAP
ncbi:hypothetical protein UNDKW_5596 [Undibacterium sp. KW1]|nr:hypothetical protein UNDKW_5596 [Undibacterium sp. KW1]